jgi:hypothetical protein
MDPASHRRFFPIDATAAHAGVDCNACHGGTSTFREFGCTGCHEHARDLTDPMHEGMAGYAYGPATCYTCHPTGEALTRSSHAQFFPIEAGAHSGVTCTGCHVPPAGFASFDCTPCHAHLRDAMDPAHTGVAGYAFLRLVGKPAPAEVMTRTAHDPFFPILTGKHGGLACASCHVTAGTFQVFECNQCHEHLCSAMDPKHREVRGYTCVSAECYRCHPRGSGD